MRSRVVALLGAAVVVPIGFSTGGGSGPGFTYASFGSDLRLVDPEDQELVFDQPGTQTRTATLAVQDDPWTEPRKRPVLRLVRLGSTPFDLDPERSEAYVEIEDDGDTKGGEARLTEDRYVVREGEYAQIVVERGGPAPGRMQLESDAPQGFTATPGTDFEAASKPLVFEGPDATLYGHDFRTTDDGVDESDETFRVRLVDTGVDDVGFGTPTTATVTVVDDDPTPGVPMVSITALVGGEETETGHVTLRKTAGGPATAQLGFGGDAVRGEDYRIGNADSGPVTVTFDQDGEQDLTLPIALLRDDRAGDALWRTLEVTITGASDGAEIGLDRKARRSSSTWATRATCSWRPTRRASTRTRAR